MTPKKLTTWRLSLGLTQWQAAQELGISRAYLAHMEGGSKPISKRTWLACMAIEKGCKA